MNLVKNYLELFAKLAEDKVLWAVLEKYNLEMIEDSKLQELSRAVVELHLLWGWDGFQGLLHQSKGKPERHLICHQVLCDYFGLWGTSPKTLLEMIRTIKPVDEYYIQQLKEFEQRVLVLATKEGEHGTSRK